MLRRKANSEQGTAVAEQGTAVAEQRKERANRKGYRNIGGGNGRERERGNKNRMMAGFSPYFAVFLNDNRVTWREFCQSGIEVLHPPVAVVLSQLHTVSQDETSYLQKYQTVDLLQT